MTKETLMYYNKEISMLGISKCTKDRVERNFEIYYSFFQSNENNEKLEYMIQDIFGMKRKEARYVYLLCKIQYLNDITPLPPKKFKTKEKELSFNNLNEWAEYRALHGTRFKDIDFYKCLIEFYQKYTPSIVKKILEEQFQLDKPIPNSYVYKMYRDYCKKVKTEV